MRSVFAYTAARIVLFVVALGIVYLAGARGLLALAIAVVVSGLVSFVLLSRQRDAMSGVLTTRLRNPRPQGAGQRDGQPAGPRDDQPAGQRDGQSAGPRDGQLAGPRGGQLAGPRDGQLAGQGDGQSAGQREGQRGGLLGRVREFGQRLDEGARAEDRD